MHHLNLKSLRKDLILSFYYLDQNGAIHIRRSDQRGGQKFHPAELTPNFLMEVFELETIPKFLQSETTGLTAKINPSNLSSNDFYTVKGPGLDVAIKRTEIKDRSSGKHWADRFN